MLDLSFHPNVVRGAKVKWKMDRITTKVTTGFVLLNCSNQVGESNKLSSFVITVNIWLIFTFPTRLGWSEIFLKVCQHEAEVGLVHTDAVTPANQIEKCLKLVMHSKLLAHSYYIVI